jgi:hypothetical protein
LIDLEDDHTLHTGKITGTHAFIIRIWNEAAGDERSAAVWCGSIDHVGSDKRLYFYNLDGIVRFIQEQTGMAPPRPTSWWRSLIAKIRRELKLSQRKPSDRHSL